MRPVALAEWQASTGNVPRNPGEPVFVPELLIGTQRESANRIGAFGARLSQEYTLPSDTWTKIPFDEVLWDTAGMFDPRHGAFVANGPMQCSFMGGVFIVIPYAIGLVRVDVAMHKNGSPEIVQEGGDSGYPDPRRRTGPAGMGSGFHTGAPLNAVAGDLFEMYVRHNVGAEVNLSGKDTFQPHDPRLLQPTANHFMGMYVAIR